MIALLLATGLAFLFASREAHAGRTPGVRLVLLLGAPVVVLGALGTARAAGYSGGTETLIGSASGVVCTAAPVYALARRGHTSRGDVAMFAIVGALLGPVDGLYALTMALCIATGYALLRVTLRGDLAGLLRVLLGLRHKNLSAAVRCHLIAHEPVMLGAPLAMGLLILLGCSVP